jgi:sigma-E factor negative regulatory protein RseB
MLTRRLLCAFAALCASGTFVSAFGQASSPGTADGPIDGNQVRAWLMRIHEAASHRNFQGTFVVSAGGSVSSSRIAHFCEGANQFERIESMDGQLRTVYRHNDVVHTLWPQSRLALVEQRNLLTSFPALLQSASDHITDFYEVRPRGTERVAGHEASVLLLQPRDARRYGYRLWADKNSGLLLRAEVLGEHNEVLEASAFSDVTIGVRPQPESVLLPMRKLEGYRVTRPRLSPTTLEAEGWTLKPAVPGFEAVSCVKRAPLDAAAGEGSTAPPMLQSIYADGLTYVSVFIEPFDPRQHMRAMHTSIGATQTMMRRQGDWWVTVVGDVPPATLKQFANALERKP